MHPSFSIILFTVSSGIGYGLLALTGLLAAGGLVVPGERFGPALVALGLALVTLGLLSSTAHLGQPRRAWRAFSQWRTSWLSREGVAAVASYVPALLLAGALLGGATSGWIVLLGLLTAALSLTTVWCTGMIYRSLKPIRQWANRLTVPVYLALALLGGALWLQAATTLATGADPVVGVVTLVAVLAASVLKQRWWQEIDAGPRRTIGEATGLGGGRRVRALDPPHTEANYLMKEMGFRIARKHARRLRGIALVAGFALPLLLTLLLVAASLWLATPAAAVIAVVAALAGSFGLVVERWLFFAEATHTVRLYYGAEAA